MDGRVPVLAAVVTVSDQALSGFCVDGFERSHRQSAGGATWIATTFTGEVYGDPAPLTGHAARVK